MLSWVNETNMKKLKLQFSGFLGAHQGVFGSFGLILISDSPGLSMPLLDNNTCAERGYLFML